jgi:uncharacterized protein (TIGR03435 family)
VGTLPGGHILIAGMLRKIVLAIVVAMSLCGQAFEVTSLKPSAPGSQPAIGPSPGGERLHASGVTLKTMIQTACHVRAEQVVGGPDWIDRDRFDMEAKAGRSSSGEELRAN